MTCTAQELIQTKDEFHGGSDGRYRHPFVRSAIYTEGVNAVIQKASAYWLLDEICFNAIPVYAKAWLLGTATIGIVKVVVNEKDKAFIELILKDDEPSAWAKEIEWTTFPQGEWYFYIGTDEVEPEQYVSTLHLPEEY